MFAVLETGGKQYKVSAGDVIQVEKLDKKSGENVTFEKVLAAGEGANMKVGAPYLAGCAVTGEVTRELLKGKKIIIFKKRHRKNYRRKTGHRQTYTQVKITGITGS